MNTFATYSLAHIRLSRAAAGAERMRRPWEKHFRMALVLSALGFAAGVWLNLMLGAALGAAALFVALRPLFLHQGNRSA